MQGEVSLEVDAERITIQERMNQVVDIPEHHRCAAASEQLFEGLTTAATWWSFLALLEMAKMQRLRIYRSDPEAPFTSSTVRRLRTGRWRGPGTSRERRSAPAPTMTTLWAWCRLLRGAEDAGEDYDESSTTSALARRRLATRTKTQTTKSKRVNNPIRTAFVAWPRQRAVARTSQAPGA
ncbi:MAG: hypothetical protein IPG81_33570 [Sandaracinaceae bacterium]|nr:hypothetical protein [Sandaracinaceae bacterium]